MPQEFKPLSVGNNVTVIPCVEPVKKIVWIFVMIFSKCLLNRYFIFSLNPPPFFCLEMKAKKITKPSGFTLRFYANKSSSLKTGGFLHIFTNSPNLTC